MRKGEKLANMALNYAVEKHGIVGNWHGRAYDNGPKLTRRVRGKPPWP